MTKLSAAERRISKDAAGVALVVAAVGAAAIGAIVLEPRADEARRVCGELLDHYVELRARAVDDDRGPAALAVEKSDARARAEREGALTRCTEHLTRSAEVCARSATNDNQFEQCFP